MDYILSNKLRIGISACNAGAHVRWNRAGWDRIKLLEREKDAFIWIPVCPEVNSGFGTPRETIKLAGGNGQDILDKKAKVKNRHGRDVTSELLRGCEISKKILDESRIDAFVYMNGGPTCGVHRTTLKNQSRGKPPGLFGAILLKEDIFLIPALDLESHVKWWDWRRRLHAFVWLKNTTIQSKREIIEIWHKYKFVCQELDRKIANDIGHKVANMPNKLTSQFIHDWKKQILQLIRQPSSIKKIRGALQKHISHYCKSLNESCDISPNDIQQGSNKLYSQLLDMEKRAYLKGIEFAGTPIIFRDSGRR
jgi:uncharacterized protein YbbK (DUF523 family)